MQWHVRLGCLLATSVAGWLTTLEVQACGGTFCDSAPVQPMPVDQTGESILFVMDGNEVEAHVQIQYEGEAERFAWVVPMQAAPKVSVGSQPLFDSMLSQTVPNYLTTLQAQSCGPPNSSFTGTNGSSSITGGTSGTTGGMGPEILLQETVGTFDVTVLSSSQASEVTDWLIDNEYDLPPQAIDILAEYVDLEFVFAAIKLTAGADMNEIHPLVFRYEGSEPCVPLKLTGVAAKEDMAVRAFFLGDDRVYPLNYRHVELNTLRVDWANQGANYQSVVSRAVDEAGADGHAFITEYAGTSANVNNANIYQSSWNSDAFRSLLGSQVVPELIEQNLLICGGTSCNYAHPLVLPLLREFLPVPSGQEEATFYACLSLANRMLVECATLADDLGFDAEAFAEAFEARIVEPGRHASELLDQWPYLTRLFTTIDPDEMTVDPTFVARSQQSPTVSPNMQATQTTTCEGDSFVTLPDSRRVNLDNGVWPVFSSNMPFAQRIEEVMESGEVSVLVDNGEQIDEELAHWNGSVDLPAVRETSDGCTLGLADQVTGTARWWALGLLVGGAWWRKRWRARG